MFDNLYSNRIFGHEKKNVISLAAGPGIEGEINGCQGEPALSLSKAVAGSVQV